MSEDEDEQPTRDQAVETVAAEMLKHGTVERAESALRQKTALSSEEIEDLVAEAQMRLVSSAPPEIRASMTTIIGYHRWNALYRAAMMKGNTADAIAAQKQLDRLMQSIH